MPTRTEADGKQRRAAMALVTAMEEIPVLTDAERDALLASLKLAQAEMAAGDYTELKPGELEPWLLGELADARKRQKKHGL